MSLIDATELLIVNELFGGTAFAADATLFAELFTVVPADDGSGGTEANYAGYARVSVTNNATNFPSANPKLNGTAVNFPQATGAQAGTIKALGWNTASTAGTIRAIARLVDTVVPFAVGLNAGDIVWAPGHAFTNDMQVVMWAPAGATLPTGYSADTPYFVISVSGNSFQLSLTQGGAAVVITVDGAMSIGRSRHTSVNIGDTPSVAVNGFSLTMD